MHTAQETAPEVKAASASITEADVIAFFQRHVAAMKRLHPDAYCTLGFDFGTHSTGYVQTQWSTYCSALPAGSECSGRAPSLNAALAHVLDFPLSQFTKEKAAQMRRDAQAMLAKADEIESSLVAQEANA